MLWLSYLVFFIVVVWFVNRGASTWLPNSRLWVQAAVRFTSALIAGIFIVIGLFVVLSNRDLEVLELLLPLASMVGGLILLLGLLIRSGRPASVARQVGWFVLVGVTAIPSQLTLLLPLLACVALTLDPMPRGRALSQRRRGGSEPPGARARLRGSRRRPSSGTDGRCPRRSRAGLACNREKRRRAAPTRTLPSPGGS